MSNNTCISRREFLARLSLLGTLAATYPATALAELRRLKAEAISSVEQEVKWQRDPAWRTIAEVQEVLFPADVDVPGAADIGATIYLHDAIENPEADAADKDFIFRGVGWLDDLTQQRHKRSFVQLTPVQQQQIIEEIVKSRAGRNWISTLLTYTLEALLSDPVYGGNINGAGWKWLQHQPGYPAPPADKRWHQLLQRRYKV